MPTTKQPTYLPELATVGEVAAWLRTTTKAVYAMVERRQLPGVVRLSRRILFRRDVLVGWLESRTQPEVEQAGVAERAQPSARMTAAEPAPETVPRPSKRSLARRRTPARSERSASTRRPAPPIPLSHLGDPVPEELEQARNQSEPTRSLNQRTFLSWLDDDRRKGNLARAIGRAAAMNGSPSLPHCVTVLLAEAGLIEIVDDESAKLTSAGRKFMRAGGRS